MAYYPCVGNGNIMLAYACIVQAHRTIISTTTTSKDERCNLAAVSVRLVEDHIGLGQ